MDCYVGASTGAFKGAILRDNTFQNLSEIKSLNPKNDEITSMIWNDDLQTEILIARMNRQLQLIETDENEMTTLLTVEGGSGAIKGLHKDNDRIFTCVESGELNVYNDVSEKVMDWKVGPGVLKMRGSSEKAALVTGGMNNLVKTWDIETGTNTWSARNVPLDMLGLEVPIMITDVRFIPGENTILEATKLHEMRLYDPRAQRRPVKKMVFMENPIMSTSLTYRQNYILAANSIGEMGLFDLRSKVHPVCKFKGQCGSIRSIDAHPTLPLCASVGIDRFLRIHDLQTRKLIHKIYCKSRLNYVLLRKELSILNKNTKKEIDEDESEYGKMKENGYTSEGEDSNPSDNSDDDVWNKMSDGKKRKVADEQEDEDEEEPVASKKQKIKKGSKRKEESDSDIECTEPTKKIKMSRKIKRNHEESSDIEVKEEHDSDCDEQVTTKKKKVIKKKKRQG